MPRDMFGDVVAPSIKVGSQAWYTVPLSILAHVVLFGAVIIIPLMAADVLTAKTCFVILVPSTHCCERRDCTSQISHGANR